MTSKFSPNTAVNSSKDGNYALLIYYWTKMKEAVIADSILFHSIALKNIDAVNKSKDFNENEQSN